jgi:small subunit ribosomal protein S1
MKLIEGVNIGQLPDIFETLTNDNQILKIKSDDSISSLNDDYKLLLKKILKKDETFREIKKDEIIKGEIFSIDKKEIKIDVGNKDFVYVENKISDSKIIDKLKVGNEIDVIITKISDNPFYIKGSITDIIRLNVSDKLKDYFHQDEPLTALVTEMKPAGFMLDIEMDNITVDAFMPTTLAGINKLTDEQKDELIGKRINVMLETLQQDKGAYVVSRRKYLQSLIPDTINNLKKEFDKDPKKIYEGFVTGTTPFGVFIEFMECLTGMIHRYNVVEEWQKEKWKTIEPGMIINFYIKEIIPKKSKIILTQILRQTLWDTIRKDKIVKGKVIDIKPFGALVKLDEETNGLIQSSYLSKNNVDLKVGDDVTVKVLNVIKDDRKIYLALNKKTRKSE